MAVVVTEAVDSLAQGTGMGRFADASRSSAMLEEHLMGPKGAYADPLYDDPLHGDPRYIAW